MEDVHVKLIRLLMFMLSLVAVAPAVAQDTAAATVPVDTTNTPAQGGATDPSAPSTPSGLMGTADRAMGALNSVLSAVIFFDVLFWDDDHALPLVVLWLILGATYLTLKMGFINLRGFRHAINLTRGKYSDPSHPGEVSHFQALSAALSATVGLGNIAGVAIAVSLGGPGATFWMILAGLLGMSSKFAECTLGQQYRQVGPGGRRMGGEMCFLGSGLAQEVWPGVGKEPA